MTFQVDVPANTPPERDVFLWSGNSYIDMYKIADNTWETVIFHTDGWDFSYFYQLGTYYNWEQEYDSGSPRKITTEEKTITDEVTAWRWLRNATGSTEGSVNITLIVTVPHYTPNNSDLYLVGDPFESRTVWSDPQGQLLTKLDSHSYSTTLLVDPNTSIELSLTRGSWAKKATRNFTITPQFNGQLINTYIDGWVDLEAPWNRTSLFTGAAILDWWSSAMKPSVRPAFERFAQEGGEWIQYAVIWNFDHILPTPYGSTASGVYTPDEDLLYIIKEAHRAGLGVFLTFGYNTEMTPDADGVGLPAYNEEEWAIYRQTTLDFLSYYSLLAEENGVEVLGLPDYIGPNETEFDDLMNESIQMMRQNYTGLIASGGSTFNDRYDYYYELDFIGMKLWDNILTGNDNPSVEQLEQAFGERLDSVYLPIHQTYNKSISFNQIAYASTLGSNYVRNLPYVLENMSVPFQQDIQARVFEAFFRAIANRTWIEGGFSFGTAYWELSFPEYSVAHNLAESVILKWAQMVGLKEDIDVNSQQRKMIHLDSTILTIEDQRYTEFRIKTATDQWSSWNAWSSQLNLTTLLGMPVWVEGEYIIWLQARNQNWTSNPVAVRIIINYDPPFLGAWSLKSNYMPQNFTTGVFTLDEDTILTFEYLDDLDLTIYLNITGTENWYTQLSTKFVTLPVSLFVQGTYFLEIRAKDSMGNLSLNFTWIFEIGSTSTTTPTPTTTSTSTGITSTTTTITSTGTTSTTTPGMTGIVVLLPMILVVIISKRKRKHSD
ncbi:MAG: hypothetical protein ACFFBD_21680, partial [Candidatus Hodarchaeota archaeon]